MSRPVTTALALAAALVCCARMAAAEPIDGARSGPPRAPASEPFLLAPPEQAGPVVVLARFELHDINEIDDGAETFEFTGVLRLEWHDPRQAFDPAVAGVDEKIFQGAYQFDEISTGWYPQVVLVNESGLYQKSGVLLRVRPDGTSILIETLNAAAELDVDMSRFPLDGHRLEAVFEVLGFDRDEVLLQVDPDAARPLASEVRVPQWTITGSRSSVRDRSASYAGRRGVSSAFVVSVDVQRRAFYTVRLVVLPLIVVVLLSFSVFWMDRSSLGDRLSVSFIGILTGVAYQIVMSDHLPRISYCHVDPRILEPQLPDHVRDRRGQPGGGRAGRAGRARAWRSHRSPLPMGIPSCLSRTAPRPGGGGGPVLLGQHDRLLRGGRQRIAEPLDGTKAQMSQVEFWFEFASTYSYPAALRVEKLARSAGVGLAWRPFLLGPIFEAQGWSDSPFNLYPAKGRYMWRDLERICGALGLPFQRPSQFPRRGLLAARLACRFSEAAWLPEFVRQVYLANFAHDRDISDPAVVGSILEALGQPASLLAEAESAEAKARLRSETQRAQGLGIFGAPTLAVGSELFWGNDRLEDAIAWASRTGEPAERTTVRG